MPPKKRFDKKNAVTFSLISKQPRIGEEYDPDAPKYNFEPKSLPKGIKHINQMKGNLNASIPKELIVNPEEYETQTVFYKDGVDENDFDDHLVLTEKQQMRLERNVMRAFGDNDDGDDDDEDYEYYDDEDFDDEELFDNAEEFDDEVETANRELLSSQPSKSQKALYAYDYNKHFRPMTGQNPFYGPNGLCTDPEIDLPIIPAIAVDDVDLAEIEETEISKKLASKHTGTVKSVISGLEIPVAPAGKNIRFTTDFLEAMEVGNECGFLELEDNFYELAMMSDEDDEYVDQMETTWMDAEEERLIDNGLPPEIAAALAAAKARTMEYHENNPLSQNARVRFADEFDDEDEYYDDEDDEDVEYEDLEIDGDAELANILEEEKVQALMAKLAAKKGTVIENPGQIHYDGAVGDQERRLMQMFLKEVETGGNKKATKSKRKNTIRFKDEIEEEEEDFEEDYEDDYGTYNDEEYDDDYDPDWDDNRHLYETMRLLEEMESRVENRILNAGTSDAEMKIASEEQQFIDLLHEYEHQDEDEDEELGLNDPSLIDSSQISPDVLKTDVYTFLKTKQRRKDTIMNMTPEERVAVNAFIKKRLAEIAVEDDSMETVAAAIEAQFRKKPKEAWDAESICSTYSNVSNIPSMIKEVRVKKQSNIKISNGIRIPMGVMKRHREEREQKKQASKLETISEEAEEETPNSIAYIGDNRHNLASQNKQEDEDINEEDEDEEYEYVIDTSAGRNKKETKEQKKARKAAIKAEKADRRLSKKKNKEMFTQEKKKQDKMEVMNRSLNMAHMKLI